MRKLLSLMSITVLLSAHSFCQTTDNVSAKSQFVIDKIVDSSIIGMSIELNEYFILMDSIDSKTSKNSGYRIQVFSSSGPNAKKDALQSQSDFLKIYRDYPSYTKWNYPNWVVRLGDYRTQLEAMEFHNEITSLFPASFIVKDEINVQ